jgi:hypothetical protein
MSASAGGSRCSAVYLDCGLLHHLVITDPRGLLPDFLRELHRLTAKAINASQGQWEHLWAAEPCNRPFRTMRPIAYFSEEGTCPPELTLVLDPPVSRDGAEGEERSPKEWRERLKGLIAAGVATVHRSMAAEGRAFLGRDAVLGASFAQRARAYEERRGGIPTFAARLRSVRERLRRVERAFRTSYRAALALWRSGQRAVKFPHGTWGRVVFHSATVGEPLAA